MKSTNVPVVGLAFLLSQVGAHAANCFEKRLAAIGLTAQYAGLLRMVGSNAGMTQQAAAELFGIFPSRLVALLDELEEKQLLTRRRGATDRRSHHLHLTPAGRKRLRQIGTITRDLEEDLLSSLCKTEREGMTEQLRRIVAQQNITPAVHPAYRTAGTRQSATTKEKDRS